MGTLADQLAFSLKMLELFFLVTLQFTFTSLIDKQNQCIFSFLNLYLGLKFLANSVDPDPCKQCGSRSASFFRSWLIRIYTVCHTMYAVLYNLVHMSVTCFCMLKIASSGLDNDLDQWVFHPLLFKLISILLHI